MHTLIGVIMNSFIFTLITVIAVFCYGIVFAEEQDTNVKKDSKYWFKKGTEFENNNLLVDAIEAYTKSINLEPDQYGTYNKRAILYKNIGEYDNALNDINLSIKYKPNNCKAYDTKGNIYSKKSQYRLAIDEYTKAIKICNGFAGAYMNRGITYKKMSNIKMALKDYVFIISLAESGNEEAKSYVSDANEYINDVKARSSKK